MIRMVLFGAGFMVITISLLVFQPGNNRARQPVAVPQPVTRAEPSVVPAPVEDLAEIEPVLAAAPEPRPAPRPVLARPEEQGDLDDQSLRKLTWQTLSSLNQATGRERAPGQPGSLLHTIVRRSLDEGTAVTPSNPIDLPGDANGSYVVQPGDSLVSIAELVYGDINMTGPLFAANQSMLARPDDLSPGQVLILPAQ